MARYIDAEKLEKHFEYCIAEAFNTNGVTEDFEIALKATKNQPTANVSPVVRCKDCVLHGHCSTEDVFLFSRIKAENAFCCVGKKEGE